MHVKSILAVAVVTLLTVTACETDDVEGPQVPDGPEVLMTLNPSIINENGGVSSVEISLSSSSTQDVQVNLGLTGSATEGTDFNINTQEILIMAGDIAGAATITAIDNSDEDGSRSVVVTVTSVSGGYTDGTLQQVLEIEDDEGPITTQLLLNEILYDPPSGIEGDANGDGVREAQGDEFLELVNLSSMPLDMSGFFIYDAEALTNNDPRHVFPDGSILNPGQAIVVFGGGTPTGGFGGSLVQTASSGLLNMNNSGDFMTITDAMGAILVEFDIEPLSNNPDESYTRNPDLTGEFEQHNDNTPLLFSPGTRVDESAF